MAINPSQSQSFREAHPIVISAAAAAVLIGAIVLLSAIFGMQASGPSYEFVPDPAGTVLPF
jgi:hypothetical protein